MSTKYLSEFEQEFEMDDEANSAETPSSEVSNDHESDSEYSYEVNDEFENDDEFERDDEFENDDELENDDEYEIDNEFENDDEFESDDEFENDYAVWSRDGHYDRDREFESRLYRAIRSNADNELQTELELDNVLHEMEQDYFFKSAKNWVKRKARKYGKFAVPGYGALKAISSLGRVNIRNLLKNKLLQTAAGFIPGAGPIVSKAMGIAGNVMSTADAAKQKIQDVVQVGKDAYQDLATAIPDAQNEMEVRAASKIALRKAISNQLQRRDHRTQRRSAGGNRAGRGNRTKRVFPLPPNARVAVFATKISINKRQQVIPIKPNSIVVVKTARLIVWEPK
jgi:hypothetical protein